MTDYSGPCQCEAAGFCPVLNVAVVGRRFKICHDNVLSEEKRAAYREAWVKYENYVDLTVKMAEKEGVGTEVAGLIKWLGFGDFRSCDRCYKRLEMLNSRGPDWSWSNRSEVTGWLVEEWHRRELHFTSIKPIVARFLARALALLVGGQIVLVFGAKCVLSIAIWNYRRKEKKR